VRARAGDFPGHGDVVWNIENQSTRLDSIEEPAVYQEFFDRLSKSICLELQEI